MNYSSNIPRTSSASSDCSSSSLEPSSNHIESRSSRLRSLPITIVGKKSQTPQVKPAPANHMIHSYASSKALPPSYLSLNTDMANQQAQQSDSMSDCSVTTPIADGQTNNAAIFPFSPNSPNSGTNKQIFSSQPTNNCEDQKRKCLVDGTTGTLRLSECESDSTYPTTSQNSKTGKITLDGLSSDYADMTLGSSGKHSMRNTGPTLSPKENIKKLKSSFFGCNKIDENKMDCSSASNSQKHQATTVTTPTTPTTPTTNSINLFKCDENTSDYTIMNPVLPGRRIVAQQPPLHSMSTSSSTIPMTSKKTALVTSNNNPDKILAQVKTSFDGFKPIASRADKEISQQKSKSPANTSFNRQHSAPVEKGRKPSSDCGAYELLELRASSSATAVTTGNRIARPNSVNSEKTTFTPLMRPNSANSERQSTSTFSLTSTTESGATSVSLKE